jgi:hypothetical protein
MLASALLLLFLHCSPVFASVPAAAIAALDESNYGNQPDVGLPSIDSAHRAGADGGAHASGTLPGRSRRRAIQSTRTLAPAVGRDVGILIELHGRPCDSRENPNLSKRPLPTPQHPRDA